VASPADLQEADAVVLPGSKSTVADLRWLWHSGLAAAIQRLAARGVPVVGICGGYQMLGTRVLDPGGHESRYSETPGLALLDVQTEFAPPAQKVTVRTAATISQGPGPFAGQSGRVVSGYEIHMGRTWPGPGARPLLQVEGRPDTQPVGTSDSAGQVWGTYLHEIFHNDALRRSWLAGLWRRSGLTPPPDDSGSASVHREESLDRLAAAVRTGLDMDRVYRIMGVQRE